MRTMIVVVMVLVLVGVGYGQIRPVSGNSAKVVSISTADSLHKFYLGGGEKDISLYNMDGSDTLRVYPFIRDTASALWGNRILVLPGWINNKLTRYSGDTLFVQGSGALVFYYEATRR